jgi:glycosyltransferase involved in cell wall biosynthesis
VLGGQPALMRAALDHTAVTYLPADTLLEVSRQALAGPRPDVLHTHMTAADIATIGPAALMRRPVVSTLHFAGGRGHSALTRLAYRSLRAGLGVEVAVSDYVALTAPGNPRVVTMGIPAPIPVTADDVVARQPVVLVAQRLEREKATDVAIQAWKRSGLAEEGWRLVVAGRGAERAQLEALAEQLGAAESIDFVGHDPDVLARMATASILLAPRPDEAFGLTVVEAMAAGLPVVAAAGGGHLETLGPVTPETLFVPGDVDGAATRLRILALDPARRAAVSRRVQERFEARFRIERHVDDLEALYLDTVSRGRWPGPLGRRRTGRHTPTSEASSAPSAGVERRPSVAIAHDYLTQRGGAERVVLALHDTFPEAAIHTTVHEQARTFSSFGEARVITSPLQRLGALRRNPRLALPVLAPVVSRMHIDADVTVCSTPGWAHGMHTSGAKVLYVHNTARWLYQSEEYLDGMPFWYRLGLAPFAAPLRRWDRRNAAAADVILVNSAVTQDRVLRHWGRDSEIVHPPPGLNRAGHHVAVPGLEPGFLLTVSRLLPYKRIDAVLRGVELLNQGAGAAGPTRLVVVGSGPDRARLDAFAPPGTVWLEEVRDDQLRWLYANAEALVTAAHDDFGLTPLEAMQFGTPVVAVREGGFPETVVEGETGVLFDGTRPADVCRGLLQLRSRSWDRTVIEARAALFSSEAFADRIQAVVAEVAGVEPESDPCPVVPLHAWGTGDAWSDDPSRWADTDPQPSATAG